MNHQGNIMRYIFLTLLLLNAGVFGYYTFLHKATDNQSLAQAQASLTNPVTATNVTSELPPMIGTKK